MAEQQGIFVQKIVHVRSGKEFDVQFLKVITLVETMDLSGPRLMMEFDDPHSWIKDQMVVQELDEITLTIADIYARDGIDEVLKFIILGMKISGNSVKFDAIQKHVFDLKKPVTTARLFTHRQAGSILATLFPGLKVDAARCPQVEDYHILSGERPSYMLRQLGREQGGHVYVRRDTACLHRLDEVMKRVEADFIYHNEKPDEENQVITYKLPSTQTILEDRLIRRHTGWNITKGWVSAPPTAKTAPPERYPSASVLTLGNVVKAPRTVLDFTCTGNGFLTAGLLLDFVWHMRRPEAPLDEALPARGVIWTVAHSYSAQKYFCRVQCAVPLEPKET